MRSSDEKYVQKILADTKNTQERKTKKSLTGPYESEGRGFESLPAHQEPVTYKMSQALFFVVSRKISKVDDRFPKCVL